MQCVGGGNVIEKVNSLGDKILKSTSSILMTFDSPDCEIHSTRYRLGRHNNPHVNWVWRQVTQTLGCWSLSPTLLKSLKSSTSNDLELK